ncbi:MAG: hypothetical protein IKJ42_03550 [Bacteroidaceae bacterium]|nr:hypothetical protein [Bacteroidaceae bacterium]
MADYCLNTGSELPIHWQKTATILAAGKAIKKEKGRTAHAVRPSVI